MLSLQKKKKKKTQIKVVSFQIFITLKILEKKKTNKESVNVWQA